MTIPFYNEMAELVIGMLNEFGTDIELGRTLPNGTVEIHTLRIVYTDPVTYRIRPVELDQADLRFVTTNAFKPIETDRITTVRGRFILIRIEAIQPADKVLGYRCEARSG